MEIQFAFIDAFLKENPALGEVFLTKPCEY